MSKNRPSHLIEIKESIKQPRLNDSKDDNFLSAKTPEADLQLTMHETKSISDHQQQPKTPTPISTKNDRSYNKKLYDILIFGDKKSGKETFMRNIMSKKIQKYEKNHQTEFLQRTVVMSGSKERIQVRLWR